MMRNAKIVSLFLPVALLVSSALVVAACGTNPAPTARSLSTPVAAHSTTPAASSSPTSTQPAAASSSQTRPASQPAANSAPAPSPSSQPATHPQNSPASVQNCGKIELSPLHRFEDGGLAQQSGTCFWQDFQQCRAATLTYHPLGVDTTTNHTFAITKQAAGCTVTDSVSHAIAPQSSTLTTYTCTGLLNDGTALHFTACGKEGDVLVPLTQ